jgi:hypothetical protein
MEKVVPLFNIFTTIFYFHFFKLMKFIFWSVKVLNNLNQIWTRFEFEINSDRRRMDCSRAHKSATRAPPLFSTAPCTHTPPARRPQADAGRLLHKPPCSSCRVAPSAGTPPPSPTPHPANIKGTSCRHRHLFFSPPPSFRAHHEHHLAPPPSTSYLLWPTRALPPPTTPLGDPRLWASYPRTSSAIEVHLPPSNAVVHRRLRPSPLSRCYGELSASPLCLHHTWGPLMLEGCTFPPTGHRRWARPAGRNGSWAGPTASGPWAKAGPALCAPVFEFLISFTFPKNCIKF